MKKPQTSASITDSDLEELIKISDRLDPKEKVELVATQSRIHPGGSVSTPEIPHQ